MNTSAKCPLLAASGDVTPMQRSPASENGAHGVCAVWLYFFSQNGSLVRTMRTLIFAAVLLFAACDSSESSGQSEGAVRQGPPNTNYQPAFVGQSRAPEMRSGVTIASHVIASGLDHPWAIVFLPDGRMLVTERAGRLRVVTREGSIAPPVQGLPPVDARG